MHDDLTTDERARYHAGEQGDDPTPTAPKCPFHEKSLPIRSLPIIDDGADSREWSSEVVTADGETLTVALAPEYAAFIAHAINSHATLTAEVERLREALETAFFTIKALHGHVGWQEYQHSPEMKRINTALNAVGGDA